MYKVLPQKLWQPSCAMAKLLLIMRLTTIILITAIMQVSAITFAQKITLSEKNASLDKVFEKIRLQSGYDFMVSSGMLKEANPVNIQVKDVELAVVLKQLFEKQPLAFDIKDNTVVVSRKTPSFLDRVVSAFAAIDIRGKVVAEDGSGLAGATVKVKGTGKSVTTDGNGDFYLQGVDENATIVVSYVGYKVVERAAEKEMGTIRLEMTSGDLEEVRINKGLYTTTKELNTGNVTSVKANVIENQPVGNPMLALQGRVAGLTVSQQSGIPGSGLRFSLRGKNSVRAVNDPLFIVDGVVMSSSNLSVASLGGALATNLSPFATLRLDDIESIDVLKDADATAIYGSLGANGVILVTTKRGKAGKTLVSANVDQGVGEIATRLDLMNTEEYLEMRRKAFENDGATVQPTDYDLNGSWGDINRYTDWQDLLWGGKAKTTDAQVAVSGGSAQTQFRFSLGYRREGTVFQGDYFNRKGTGQLSVNHESENKKFKIGGSVSYLNDYHDIIPDINYTNYILLAPNAPEITIADGSLNWANSTWTNPFYLRKWSSVTSTNNLNSSFNSSYQLSSNLSVSLKAGFNNLDMDATSLSPIADQNPAWGNNPGDRFTYYGGTQRKTWNIEPGLNYAKTIGSGKIEALIGIMYQDVSSNSVLHSASGFTSDRLISNPGLATTLRASSLQDTRYKYNAIYARVGYDLKGRYVLNVTGRRDGSSRFGPGRQFGNFGSVAGAWIFNKERFTVSTLPFLSFGKIRASYGVTGNDQIGNEYAFLSLYSAPSWGAYQGISSLAPSQLYNPDFSWESVKKLEAALDLGFFNDRLTTNITWYRNRTSNQLVLAPLPDMAGFRSVQANLPAVLQNSGVEMELNTINFQGDDFKWTTSFNVSLPKSKLISFPGLAGTSYASQYAIGKSLYSSFRYHYTGIDPVTGAYTVEDTNKDGRIATDDRTPIDLQVKFFGGLSNTFEYKGLQLDVLLQFTKQEGNGYYSLVPPGLFFADGSNQLASVLTEVNKGDQSSVQKLTQDYASPGVAVWTNFKESDGVLQNTSFIRVKNVALSWTLPAQFQQKLKLQNAKIYFQGQNLFTISKNGIDPEFTSLALPPLRVLSLGIQIGL